MNDKTEHDKDAKVWTQKTRMNMSADDRLLTSVDDRTATARRMAMAMPDYRGTRLHDYALAALRWRRIRVLPSPYWTPYRRHL